MGWFFIVAVITSLGIGFYLGFRLIDLFNCRGQGYFSGSAKKIFWGIILLSSLTFVAGRAFNGISNYWLPFLGNFIFALLLCLFYTMLAFDIIRFINRYLLKNTLRCNKIISQISYLPIGIALFIIGLYSASCPQISHYQIDIDKVANVEQLKIVQLSDIHISETTSPAFIQTMVDKVNQLNADYIFITGDTLDMRLQPYLDKNLATIFAQLQSQYGTFIIFGNHEHYGIANEENNSTEAVVAAFEAGNMKVLLDSVFYDDKTGVYLIGRDDYIVHRLGVTRADLASLVYFADEEKPKLLLDHQPQDLQEPADLGVDVMFSGHTHAGQIFPMTLLVNAMYINPLGRYHPEGSSFTSIVSSGYGLWGPPIRLMTRAEIVVTDINFKKASF